MSEEKVNFFNLPEEKAVVRPALKQRAKELGLIINPGMEHKIVWSESHGGRCMCDWNNRKCPCDNIQKDLAEFNGECLCKVLVTVDKMEKIKNNSNKKQKKKKEKTEEQINEDNIKIKEAKELAKKLLVN